jgi:hypothetical protein
MATHDTNAFQVWEAGELTYSTTSAFVALWGKERETLVLKDQVAQVIAHLQRFLDLRPALAPIIHSLSTERGADALPNASPTEILYRLGSD